MAESGEFWQHFAPAPPLRSVFAGSYPATMPDGSCLELPLRDLGASAVAGLIVNQASFAVLDRLVGWVAEVARPHDAQVVVGLPTLGHVLGAGVARALGHTNWVAPGTSRKFWYEEALSVPLASVTSPTQGRRLWLDPRLVGRLRGMRVLLVDDVISTGASVRAALELLGRVDIRPVAIVAAMLQGDRWAPAMPPDVPVQAAFASPRFAPAAGGWTPLPGSEPRANCPLMS